MTQGLSAVLDAEVISTDDRTKLAALLSAAEDDSEDDDAVSFAQGAPAAKAYESHSKGIVDLLAELKVKAEGELQDLRKQEVNRKHAHDMLSQTLTNTIAQQTKEANEAKELTGTKGEALGVAKGDLATATKTLAADRDYLKD